MKRRAHRIDVDECWRCPFMRGAAFVRCEHPAWKDTPHECKPLGQLQEIARNSTPPDDCPLRGAVTLVAGPTQGFDTDGQ